MAVKDKIPSPLYTLATEERTVVDNLNAQARQFHDQANGAIALICGKQKLTGSVEYRDGAIWRAGEK